MCGNHGGCSVGIRGKQGRIALVSGGGNGVSLCDQDPQHEVRVRPRQERKESLKRAMPVFVTLIAELFVTPLAAADKSQASKANVEPQLNSYSNNYRNGQVKPGFSARSEIDPAIQQTIGQVFTPFGDSNSGAPQSVEQQAAPPVAEPDAQPAQEAPQPSPVFSRFAHNERRAAERTRPLSGSP